MVDPELDMALFDIEQDLLDLEEDLVGSNPQLADKIFVIAEKAKDLQNDPCHVEKAKDLQNG